MSYTVTISGHTDSAEEEAGALAAISTVLRSLPTVDHAAFEATYDHNGDPTGITGDALNPPQHVIDAGAPGPVVPPDQALPDDVAPPSPGFPAAAGSADATGSAPGTAPDPVTGVNPPPETLTPPADVDNPAELPAEPAEGNTGDTPGA